MWPVRRPGTSCTLDGKIRMFLRLTMNAYISLLVPPLQMINKTIFRHQQEFLQIREPGRELLQRECVGGRSSSREEAEEEEGGCGGQQQGGDHVDHDDGEMSMK